MQGLPRGVEHTVAESLHSDRTEVEDFVKRAVLLCCSACIRNAAMTSLCQTPTGSCRYDCLMWCWDWCSRMRWSIRVSRATMGMATLVVCRWQCWRVVRVAIMLMVIQGGQQVHSCASKWQPISVSSAGQGCSSCSLLGILWVPKMLANDQCVGAVTDDCQQGRPCLETAGSNWRYIAHAKATRNKPAAFDALTFLWTFPGL